MTAALPAEAARPHRASSFEREADRVTDYVADLQPYLDTLGESTQRRANVVADYFEGSLERREARQELREEHQRLREDYRELRQWDPPRSMEDFHDEVLDVYRDAVRDARADARMFS
ncbi:MAG TPA: hypothetical protein VNZ52_05315 [Candidatus Thermoplasmatota archaeon]|nr:hypothetical protein [Candidatus Thermoplasmatota archaeon]